MKNQNQTRGNHHWIFFWVICRILRNGIPLSWFALLSFLNSNTLKVLAEPYVFFYISFGLITLPLGGLICSFSASLFFFPNYSLKIPPA
jgi:hypothetical protein